MCSQIGNGRNRDLQRMVYDNDLAKTIDCNWCCDVSVSSNAEVKFSTVSTNLVDYDSLLMIPIIDDYGKM